MTDFSTEVCNAEPHFVQENLEYWVNTVKYYCPWSAKIISVSQSVPTYTMSTDPTITQALPDITTSPLPLYNRLAQSTHLPLAQTPFAYTLL